MLRLLLTLLIVLPTLVNAEDQSIGIVTAAESQGTLKRESGEKIETQENTPLQMMDRIETFQGAHRLTFIDETIVDMTAQSLLTIDDYVYDPSNNEGSLNLQAKLGTIRYASGKLAKNFRQNVKIETPTSTIGVRGTDFTMSVDELGGSTIILLPSCDISGYCYVGEIEVETDVGIVILSQAFQATYTSSRERPPAPVVQLELDENLINNMLLVRKKKLVDDEDETGRVKIINILDIDFLEFKELDADLLATEEEFNELDVNFLDFDLLPNILDQINTELIALLSMDALSGKKKDKKSGIDERGIVLIVRADSWNWSRRVDGNNTIDLEFKNDNNYNINVKQGVIEIYNYELGGTGGNDVTIQQIN